MTDADPRMQHPPAMRVGGRRMSAPARPKPTAPRDTVDRSTADDEAVDYPRPAAPGEQIAHQHHSHEEEQPKNRRTPNDEHERRVLEAAQKRAEINKPTKDFQAGGKNTGGLRINQPSGKILSM